MRKSAFFRVCSSIAVALMALLLIEVPALAYPSAPSVPQELARPGQLYASSPTAEIPRLAPLQIRRMNRIAAAAEASEEEATQGKWQPTMPEGSAFTIVGAGLLAGGAILLGVGMSKFMPIVLDASGLVTAAVSPMVMIGVGLTLLITGIAFLVHGVQVLKVVKKAEEDAQAAFRMAPPPIRSSAATAIVRPILTLQF